MDAKDFFKQVCQQYYREMPATIYDIPLDAWLERASDADLVRLMVHILKFESGSTFPRATRTAKENPAMGYRMIVAPRATHHGLASINTIRDFLKKARK